MDAATRANDATTRRRRRDDAATTTRARDERASATTWTTLLSGCFGGGASAREGERAGGGARGEATTTRRRDARRRRREDANARAGEGVREMGHRRRTSESATSVRSSDDSGSGSGREPDFGIDAKTYRFNRINGVATNRALLLWLKQREMWTNPGRRRAREGQGDDADRDRAMKRQIPRNASYESFLGVARVRVDREFKAPIPLHEMVEFLNQCWAEGEGL